MALKWSRPLYDFSIDFDRFQNWPSKKMCHWVSVMSHRFSSKKYRELPNGPTTLATIDRWYKRCSFYNFSWLRAVANSDSKHQGKTIYIFVFLVCLNPNAQYSEISNWVNNFSIFRGTPFSPPVTSYDPTRLSDTQKSKKQKQTRCHDVTSLEQSVVKVESGTTFCESKNVFTGSCKEFLFFFFCYHLFIVQMLM